MKKIIFSVQGDQLKLKRVIMVEIYQ